MKTCRLVILTGALAMLTSGCVALGLGAAGGAAAGGVESKRAEEANPRYSAGTYVGTVLANAVYVPAKIIFAGAGAVTSGATYLVTLGDKEPTQRIWDASVGGDYVVTPAMVSGKKDVAFVG